MKLKFLLIITIMLLGKVAFAASPASLLVNMVPPYPAPHENVSITLNSYASNLDTVLISWSVDGKIISSEIGKKSFSTTAGAAGALTSIVVTVYLPDGAIEKEISIRPSVMLLLWQANDSYVPPFYKGKALATPDSEVKIVAMPEARTSSGLIDSKNMAYSWKKDYNNVPDASGYGKNFFLYVNDYLEDSNAVSVVASTLDQEYSVEANITVGTAEPKILFYKNDSTLGTLWNMALSDTYKIQGPETLKAIPYFISPKEIRHPALIWGWFINDKRVTLTTFEKNSMPLGVSEGKHGISKLRVDIENRDKIFQAVSKEINIEF